MKKSTKVLLSSIAASILLIGCGGGGGSSSSSGTSSTGTVSGTATDGPIANAQVCLDLNFNNLCDPNEPVTNTDGEGRFSVTYQLNEANASIAPVLILPTKKSYDTYTGNLYTIKMSAPRAGHNKLVVSPITTVAAEAVYKKAKSGNVSAEDVEDAIQKVSEALDLNGTDITQINPTEDPKLLATAVTFAKIINEGNITQIAEKIVENNETNITQALPDNMKTIYTAITNSIDENTSIDTDLLQQAVENAIDNNNTDVVNIVINSDDNETAIVEALVGGYLNKVKTDLNESGVTKDLNGNALNLDFNASKAALELYNNYDITDMASLNKSYKDKDLNVTDVNVSDLLQTYDVLLAAKSALIAADINQTQDLVRPVYFDLSTGERIDIPDDLNQFNFKQNDVNQTVFYNDDEFVVAGTDKLAFLDDDRVKVYAKIFKVVDTTSDNNISNIVNLRFIKDSLLENNITLADLNASELKPQYKIDEKIYDVTENSLMDDNSTLKLDDTHYFMVVKNHDYAELEGLYITVDDNENVKSLRYEKAAQYVENEEAVKLAKNIFSSLRTQIDSISNPNDTGTLDKEADKFNAQLKDVTFDNIETAADTLSNLIDAIAENNLTGSIELDNPDLNRTFVLSTDNNLTYVYSIKDDLNGTVKEYNGTITLNDKIPEDLNSSFDIMLNVEGKLPASDEEETAQDVNTSIKVKYTADSHTFDLTVEKINVKDTDKSLKVSNIGITAAMTDNAEDLKYIKLNNFNVSGKAGDFEANGNVTVNYVQNQLIKKESNDQAFKYYYYIHGYFVCINDYDNSDYNHMNIPEELNITLDDTTIYKIPVYADQYNHPWIDATVVSANEIDEDIWYDAFNNAVAQQVKCNDENYTATFRDPQHNYYRTLWVDEDDDFLNAGWVPDSITFNGTVEDVNTSTKLIGSISASSSNIKKINLDEDYLASTIKLSVKLIRSGFADTNVNSTFTTSKDDGSTALTLSYIVDEENIGKVTLSGNWKADKSGTVTVTSTTGLKVTIPVNNQGDIDFTKTIPVYVNSKVVGYLEQRDDVPVIKYNDGTFESIN